ncbi:MAG: response regulator transcription factor [Methanomassiliicoccales archaeon]|nr:MAG: response regulator transcription factor [Methanomassiliicoccales archaeon]
MAKKKILVVDDEKNIVDLVGMILEAEGFDVSKAMSGPEGISKTQKEKPDLVLLDIMMPEMDGWVVYRKLKENPKTKNIPVAMLTVKAQTIDKEMALDVIGVEDYITKPFTPEELVERVQKLL